MVSVTDFPKAQPECFSMRTLMEELYPLPRSLTGDGVRDTLKILQRELPGLEMYEVPSGTKAFDWVVPDEWNVRGAKVVGPDGRVVADFDRHNLMLVSYSEPFRGRLTLDELSLHLHTRPDLPKAIPYVTSFFKRYWGFCMPHEEMEALEEGLYEVEVDTSLKPGSLTYAELVLPGAWKDEVLLSAHVCHPSLANDNLSGIAVLTALVKWLMQEQRKLTYRIVFAPTTLGTIVYMSRTPALRERVKHGLTFAGLGGSGPLTYEPTITGEADVDRAARLVHSERRVPLSVPFSPFGHDERQYASPGIRLPVGGLRRPEPGAYPEYHSSYDDLGFVSDESLEEAFDVGRDIILILEESSPLMSSAPYGEPQLGRRGLYSSSDPASARQALMWTLVMADGVHSLLDVAERSQISVDELIAAKRRLENAGLLVEADPNRNAPSVTALDERLG